MDTITAFQLLAITINFVRNNANRTLANTGLRDRNVKFAVFVVLMNRVGEHNTVRDNQVADTIIKHQIMDSTEI